MFFEKRPAAERPTTRAAMTPDKLARWPLQTTLCLQAPGGPDFCLTWCLQGTEVVPTGPDLTLVLGNTE